MSYAIGSKSNTRGLRASQIACAVCGRGVKRFRDAESALCPACHSRFRAEWTAYLAARGIVSRDRWWSVCWNVTHGEVAAFLNDGVEPRCLARRDELLAEGIA